MISFNLLFNSLIIIFSVLCNLLPYLAIEFFTSVCFQFLKFSWFFAKSSTLLLIFSYFMHITSDFSFVYFMHSDHPFFISYLIMAVSVVFFCLLFLLFIAYGSLFTFMLSYP